MEVNISSLHFIARPELNDFANKKIQKLSRFDHNLMYADVYLKTDNQQHKFNENDKVVEVKLHSPGHELFATASAESFEKSIALVCSKIENQIRHYKN